MTSNMLRPSGFCVIWVYVVLLAANVVGYYGFSAELTTVPREALDNRNLKVLSLGCNDLRCISAEIGNLKQLQILFLGNNKIRRIPPEIGNLKQLQTLFLGNNKIRRIPPEIGNLKQLQTLFLGNNKIRRIPPEIGNLQQLQYLYLHHNRLTSLPLSIRNITGIARLELRDNPLVEYGEGETLGWRELKAIFGGRVQINQDSTVAPIVRIDKQAVYDKMRTEHVHWNVDVLKQMKVDTVPQHTLDGNAMLAMCNDTLRGYGTNAVGKYIKQLYDIDNTQSELVTSRKSLLEAILVRLCDNIRNNTVGAADDARSYMLVLSELTSVSADGQVSMLSMIYSALYSKSVYVGSFAAFIRYHIAGLKQYMFEITVTPALGSQNVHVLNHWKYKLQHELGIVSELSMDTYTYDQDIFRNSDGNVLDAFYSKFTPSYVCGKLMEMINSNQRRLNEACAMLRGLIIDEDSKRQVLCFDSDVPADELVPRGVTQKGVEKMLVRMEILMINENDVDELISMNILKSIENILS